MLTDITARKMARQELELKNQELNIVNEQMAAAFEELKSTEETLMARNRELEEQRESMARAKHALKVKAVGASFIGGCCGTSPAFIQALATALAPVSPPP